MVASVQTKATMWSTFQLYFPASSNTAAYVQKRSGGLRSTASRYGRPPSTISLATTEYIASLSIGCGCKRDGSRIAMVSRTTPEHDPLEPLQTIALLIHNLCRRR